jgi:hypothetical protein
MRVSTAPEGDGATTATTARAFTRFLFEIEAQTPHWSDE